MLVLGGSEHSQVLASLLGLGSTVRDALAALATDPALQRGLLMARADMWPEESRREDERGPSERRAQ